MYKEHAFCLLLIFLYIETIICNTPFGVNLTVYYYIIYPCFMTYEKIHLLPSPSIPLPQAGEGRNVIKKVIEQIQLIAPFSRFWEKGRG